ncbi:MAG: flagellar motor protein MotA [Alphaproteobacteria bacterium]|nr:flagellar motor protein MotA [Alphaproteobacteria bacterium]MDA7987397.1 flagellar motor protein MotA [Alphaproteobacteria bacterium]
MADIAEPPQRYMQRMIVFLGFIAVASIALANPLVGLFSANPVFNAMILLALAIGCVLDIRRVSLLRREQNFLRELQDELQNPQRRTPAAADQEQIQQREPRLLGPMAKLLRERAGRTISPLSMRTLQDSIQSRVAESHEISRYLIGLLIFLGLLGTFWGLAEATAAVSQVVAELSVEDGDPLALFAVLQEGLQTPLAGMGTAFSTSLFGLSGALILGFLELQSSQAHNRFLEDLEEWLTGMTRLSGSALGGDGESGAPVPAYVQALLEQTTDSLERLQRTIAQGESERQMTDRNLARLSDHLSSFTDQMRSDGDSLRRLYETQAALRAALERLGDGAGGLDDASREHLRSLDLTLQELARIAAEGQEATVRTIREEMRLFARTLATALDEARDQS